MRSDVAEVVKRLRDARDPDWLRIVDRALTLDAGRPPDPDAVEPYRWFLAQLGDGVTLTAAGYRAADLVWIGWPRSGSTSPPPTGCVT